MKSMYLERALLQSIQISHAGITTILIQSDEIQDSLRSSAVLNRILIDFAVRVGYETILKMLASMKVEEMDPGNVISQMASSVACLHGRGEVAKLLINSGCAVNLNGFGTTKSISINPLLVAADRGYNSIVKSLLESGTDINFVDSEGSTALLLAISRKCRMANKKLQSRRSIIQMLLLARAGIHTRNIEGNSPFFQALATYHRSISERAIVNTTFFTTSMMDQ